MGGRIMNNLLTALTNKGYSKEEAEEIISNMREDVLAGADPEELLYEEGLEPDYIMDLIDF
jgi:hypothetical protein